MKSHWFYFLIFLTLFFISPAHALAGGGRYELGPSQHTYINSPAEIRAVIHSPSNANQPSVGEHVQFIITNPRTGDSCNPTTAISDTNGNVSSLCTAQTPGQLSVYIHSTDNSDDSNAVSMTFDQTPQQPTSVPATPTSSPQNKPLPTNTPIVTSMPTIILYKQPIRNVTPTPLPSDTPTPTLIPTPTHTLPKKQPILATHSSVLPLVILSILILSACVCSVLYFRKWRNKRKSTSPNDPPVVDTMQDSLPQEK